MERRLAGVYTHVYMLLAKKMFWFIIVPFFGYLDYYSQIRPFFLAQHGESGCGSVAGLVFALSALVLAVYLMSKIPREGNNNEQVHCV